VDIQHSNPNCVVRRVAHPNVVLFDVRVERFADAGWPTHYDRKSESRITWGAASFPHFLRKGGRRRGNGELTQLPHCRSRATRPNVVRGTLVSKMNAIVWARAPAVSNA
jgi:hypothetical protein